MNTILVQTRNCNIERTVGKLTDILRVKGKKYDVVDLPSYSMADTR